MPSIEESRRSVRQHLERDNASSPSIDHDAVLASLGEQIDRHNAAKDGLRGAMRENRRHDTSEKRHKTDSGLRFRFKSHGDERTRKRKHGSKDDEKGSESHRRHRRKHKQRASYPTPPEENRSAAHPFPREYTSHTGEDEDSIPQPPPQTEAHTNADAAFRASLFDALADDEGAAYWESVYSQPIHTFPRPAVATANGELEAMTDEAYVAWVKEKMWERKNPEVVWERGRREREARRVEEERSRRREEFVRRRERAAWERAQRGHAGDGNDEDEGVDGDGRRKDERFGHEFTGSANIAPTAREEADRAYAQAWTKYLAQWDALKYDLLTHQQQREQESNEDQQNQPAPPPATRIPWPTLPSQSLTRSNIEAFMRHLSSASSAEGRSRLQLLKAERVRWHPDKVQQRFRGAVDAETLKKVTAVFQVVDAVLEEVRKESGTGGE